MREESAEVRRVDVLRQIFLDNAPPQVEYAMREIRDLRLEGTGLVRRLEALRERYHLNPPDESDEPRSLEPQIVRIVCSDGLV